MSYWSWVLEGVGIFGAIVIGRKKWWGWGFLLVNTFLWSVYAIVSKQYGFMVASFFYAPIYARNLLKWVRVPVKKSEKAVDYFKGSQGRIDANERLSSIIRNLITEADL
jgi:nicotinamide riboside transporter PnuC